MLSNTISNSPKAAKPKFLVSGRLFCFISISKFGSFKNLFPMINSLSKFTLDSKIYSIGTNEKKKDFYELWQHHQQLKTMEMSEI